MHHEVLVRATWGLSTHPVRDYLALGHLYSLLLADVPQYHIDVVLVGDRGRVGLEGGFLEDLLLAKAHRVQDALELLQSRAVRGWQPPLIEVTGDEILYKLSVLVLLWG